MPEDQGNQDEEQFKFDSAGEAFGYIGLNQARVLAMEHARDNQDFYGRRYQHAQLV